MKTYFKTINALIGMSICLMACSQQHDSETNIQPTPETKTLSKKTIATSFRFHKTCIQIQFNPNNEFNITSAWLAGNSSHLKQPLYNDSSHWEIYHEFIDESWKKLEKQRLNKIQQWREKEIKMTDTLTHTVFYPFSGPDFLTASVLFPQADTFILLGLEPVGALPDFSKMSDEQQQNYLSHFSNSLGDIFNKSYFITRKMLNDFQAQKVNGLLPVLCFFIKKQNYDISNVKYIYKDSIRNIKEMEYYPKKQNKVFGVKITAVKDSCAKIIYYFRYNVMDKFFNDSSAFYRYLSKYRRYVTYIKSASYLLHNPFMTNMRNLILKNSVAILQDDTGIPYKYLNDTTQWTLKLYGLYDKPVKDFGKMGYQPDLAKKMKQDSASIPRLPFHLGYHWGSKKDVLLFAIKKQIYER